MLRPIVCLAAVLLSGTVAPAFAAGPYLISTYAGGIVPPTAATATAYGFRSATGAAVDAIGNLYISSGLGCVFKVDLAGLITRFAGTCKNGFSGDGGPALTAQLNGPQGVAVDLAGNVYISDTNNYRIRKVAISGTISTIAGNGLCCDTGDGGPAVNAQISAPRGIAVDYSGNVYIALGSRVRKISPSGVITTAAGTGVPGFSGDGGLATNAQVAGATGITTDAAGNFYIGESLNSRVRKVSTGGIITTFAGNGTSGYSGDGGLATSAEIFDPHSLATDSAGNVYIGDSPNYAIRKVATNGIITTFAGTGACCDSGDGGPATSAHLSYVYGIAADLSGNLFLAEYNRVRKVTGGIIETSAGLGPWFLGDGGLAPGATLDLPGPVALDTNGNFYVAELNGCRVRKIAPTGTITTVAGRGCGYSGDGGAATNALITAYSLAVDGGNNLYIGGLGVVRKVTPGGTISTVAGTGTPGYAGDGGSATTAQLSAFVGALAADSAGTLYIADTNNFRVRKVTGGTITRIVGTGFAGYSGDNGPGTNAEISTVNGLARDVAGNLYIADSGNSRVRKLALNGTITTVAGTGVPGNTGDGGPATNAELNSPYGLAFDSLGNLYIAAYSDHTVRQVSTAGIITTIAGISGKPGYTGDGGPAASAMLDNPYGLAVDANGNIAVADYSNNALRILQPGGAQPVLTLSKTHTGNFAENQTDGTFTITVSNSAQAGSTTGPVTVTENPPAGVTVVSMAGPGWVCPGNNTCSYGGLFPGTTSPPITVTVSVAPTVRSQLTNQAFISGGGGFASAGQDLGLVTPPGMRFIPIAPCRVADTRTAPGPFGGPSIAGGTIRDFTIPNSACGIPASALAYSLNVAVVPAGRLGYLTMWPTGQVQPLASTLNSIDGRIKSNAAIVPAGTGGAISVFASDTTQVVLDINGYFVAAAQPSALAFYPLTPCRIADTRKAAGPLGGPSMGSGEERSFPILAAACGVPGTAQAYSLNLAAVPKGPLGYITAWPTGQGRPLASTLNAPTGAITDNAAIVPAGGGGSVNVFASDATDLVIDINGYFAPPGAGGLSLYNVTPCRLVDTRKPAGTPPFSGVRDVPVSGGPCAVPNAAQAHLLSATVVPPGALGYLTLWPQGQTRPTVATLNALDGQITSNMAIVPAPNGVISVFASDATHLVIDISGYFAQ